MAAAAAAAVVAAPTDVRKLYERCERVGKGAFATVYRGKNKKTGEAVAIKLVRLERCKGSLDDFQVRAGLVSVFGKRGWRRGGR